MEYTNTHTHTHNIYIYIYIATILPLFYGVVRT
jgi:hypothetical protein